MGWGAVAAAGITAAGSYLGGAASNRAGALASKIAYKRQRQLMLDTPGLQAAGLEKAGLNRILAAGGQPTAPNVQQQAQPKDEVTPAIESAMQAIQLKKLESEIDLNISTAKKQKAEAEITEASVPIAQKKEEITQQLLGGAKKKYKLFGETYKKAMKKATEYEKKRKKNSPKPPKAMESRFKSINRTW